MASSGTGSGSGSDSSFDVVPKLTMEQRAAMGREIEKREDVIEIKIDPDNINPELGRLSRWMQNLKQKWPFAGRRKPIQNIQNLHNILSPRRNAANEEVSESDEGVLFGFKRKNFRAQLNLSILTFTVTAIISFLILIFAMAMTLLYYLYNNGDENNDENRYIWLGLITTIIGIWSPSPTTLVKSKKK